MKKILALLISVLMCFCSVVCFAETVVLSDEVPDICADISNVLGKDGDFYIIDTNTTITFSSQLWSLWIFADPWGAETVYDSQYQPYSEKCVYTYENDTIRTMVYEKDDDEYETDAECIKSGSVLKFLEPGTYYVGVSRTTSIEENNAGLYSAHGYLRLTVQEGAADSSVSEAVEETANYTSSKVMVDGNEVQFEAYNINDNNYFKLRDIAKVLSGTDKQFEVKWNDELKNIMLLSGMPYTEVGGELVPGDGTTKIATQGTGDIYKDNSPVEMKAYMVNGNNYFKLRDLGALFDFGISWDEANNCVMIDSKSSYVAE